MERSPRRAQPGRRSTDASWALLYFLCYVLPQTAPQVLRIGEWPRLRGRGAARGQRGRSGAGGPGVARVRAHRGLRERGSRVTASLRRLPGFPAGTVGGFFNLGSRNAGPRVRGPGLPRPVPTLGEGSCAAAAVWFGCGDELFWASGWARRGPRCDALPDTRGSGYWQTCPDLKSRVRGPLGTGHFPDPASLQLPSFHP